MEPSNTTAPIFAESVMGEWSSAKTGAKAACGSTVDRLNHGMAEAQRFGSIWPLGSPPRRLFFVRSPSRRLSSSAHPAGKSLHRTPAQRSWAEPIRLSMRSSLPRGSVRYGGITPRERSLLATYAFRTVPYPFNSNELLSITPDSNTLPLFRDG